MSPEEYPRFDSPFIPREKRAHWPGGVWGDPSKASAEKGERLIQSSVGRLVTLIQEMEARVGTQIL
jgi:creatinine amidohydrolase